MKSSTLTLVTLRKHKACKEQCAAAGAEYEHVCAAAWARLYNQER